MANLRNIGGRTPPVPSTTASQSSRSWPGPANYRLRLVRPDEVAAGQLAGLAGWKLAAEATQVLQTGLAATLLLRGVDGGAEMMLPDVAAASLNDRLPDAFAGLSLGLAAEDHTGVLAGVLLMSPPVTIVHRALDAGLDRHQVLMLALTVAEIKGIAVAEHARGVGLGAALLRRGVALYDRAGFYVLYGRFDERSELDRLYTRLGFATLDQRAAVDLDPLLDLPIAIGAEPGERLFVRWR
jgi:GNAT superfamily N-acetyltransferase